MKPFKSYLLIAVFLPLFFNKKCQTAGGIFKETDKSIYWNPYELSGKTDTVYKYYVKADSFLIRYIHSDGYMSPLVGRVICDIDSTVSDSAKKVNPFAGLINCREDTAAYRKERHYYSRITVFRIKSGKRTQIGVEMFGYYVEEGCFEDVPEEWVKQAKKKPQ